MKDDNTIFKTIHEKQFCDSCKVKEHFKAHFNICSKVVDPIELKMHQFLLNNLRILAIPS